jgi:hypothetical protein
MVIPTVAVMEIVLNGVLLPAKEILGFHRLWEGVPVPVGHPVDRRGDPVSAKTPDPIDPVAEYFFSTCRLTVPTGTSCAAKSG